jgi:hypothetical protein
MTVDDALLAMAAIEQQHDGTDARAVIVEALHRKLLEAPADFWEFYFETLSAIDPSPYRLLAERLLRSGAVHGLTTIADLPAILAAEATE